MPYKILVVDKVRGGARRLQLEFERSGHAVCCAFNCVTAEQADQEKPDLITLNFGAEWAEGVECVEILRADPTTENVPIIVLYYPLQHDDLALLYRHKAVFVRNNIPVDQRHIVKVAEGLLTIPA